jgi:hypothetical protein
MRGLVLHNDVIACIPGLYRDTKRDLSRGNQTSGADATPNSGKMDRPSLRVTSPSGKR